MSADRSSNTNNNRPLKPGVAAPKTARSPLTPRAATAATPAPRPTSSKTATVRSEPPRVAPRVRQEDVGGKDAVANGNVTPRSAARLSRAGSATPTHTDEESPNANRPKVSAPRLTAERSTSTMGLGVGGTMPGRTSRPKSLVSSGSSQRATSPPLVRSPGHLDLSNGDESIESRFFHASDARRQEPVAKKPEPKRAATFFYADGKQEERKAPSPRPASPVQSTVSEKRLSGPWIRNDRNAGSTQSPPMLSPALSGISNSSPFFSSASTNQTTKRSPSPSKENIHLSYRKGASQIFGLRPTQRSHQDIRSIAESPSIGTDPSSYFTPHKKSPSLSSIDSSGSQQSRRRSATHVESTPSPLLHELKSPMIPRVNKQPQQITDTPPQEMRSPPPAAESTFSPTANKSAAELAADARRERKVLDLEISNSSLLAINASLEREVRRQKSELKRFRRLSRAGRLSTNPLDRSARFSAEGMLSTLGEEEEGEEEEEDESAFGLPSGFTDDVGDFSEDTEDEEDDDGRDEPSSPSSAQTRRDSARLAKDEKRLQRDLEKHKELLVQSQRMNQSLKRCMYATEEMMREGRKALEFSVKVEDVRLGGRILTGHEEDEEGLEEGVGDEEEEGDGGGGAEVEVGDESLQSEDHDRAAEDFLKVWQGLGGGRGNGGGGGGGTHSLSAGRSEAGDRDSGIEADRPGGGLSGQGGMSDSGRPPDVS
ncbi:hypothetical protein D0863_15896 [Hortaea werneckii]|uniref:Uncharacterized protein n=1 Tax=Hortaea werneckii TaxID=91943 RepID=A0A3M7C268_HORWE|nr:hypothetical protein D0863_15896 [Hortaea werneckii]